MKTEKISKCASCKHNGTENGWAACDGCIHDKSLRDRYVPLTNGDRIRGMTDEELVDVIHCPLAEVEGCISGKSCALCILCWLRSPVEESHE